MGVTRRATSWRPDPTPAGRTAVRPYVHPAASGDDQCAKAIQFLIVPCGSRLTIDCPRGENSFLCVETGVFVG